MKKIIIIAGMVIGTGLGALADTPIQLSLTPDIALYPRDTQVNGFSLGIWSENPQYSFTLGLVNGSTGSSSGFSWGIVNYAETYHGVQWGWVNYCSQDFLGWQDANIANVTLGDCKGLQSSLVNVTQGSMTGLQLGVVNYSQNLRSGVQLGFINVAMNNPWFTEFPNKLATGFPILNWSF